MEHEQPLVSVVVTVYNKESFIRQTMESLLAQTYANWEAIVVNDASTDRSMEIVRSFSDPRIRILHLEWNGHVSAAHQAGDRAARGKYIAALDADDVWKPAGMEKQVAYLEAHPEAGVCFARPDFIGEDGLPREDPHYEAVFDAPNPPAPARIHWLHRLLTDGNHLSHSGAVARREALLEAGGHNLAIRMLHDYALWVRIAMHRELYVVQERLVSVRRFEGSGSLSQLNEERSRRTAFEYAWTASRAVLEMEPDLFRQVFHREMRRPEAASPEEILCEKALLLASDKLVGNCRRSAFDLFEQILRNPEARRVLDERYHTSQLDVYRLTGKPILYDYTTEHLLSQLYKELEDAQAENGRLRDSLSRRLREVRARREPSEAFWSQAERYLRDGMFDRLHAFVQERTDAGEREPDAAYLCCLTEMDQGGGGILRRAGGARAAVEELKALRRLVQRVEWCPEYDGIQVLRSVRDRGFSLSELAWAIQASCLDGDYVVSRLEGAAARKPERRDACRYAAREAAVTFVICGGSQRVFEEAAYYINRLYCPPGVRTGISRITGAKSMCAGYNQAMLASGAKYKVYLRQDVRILNSFFLFDMLDIFQADDSIGFMGVLGAREIPLSGWLEDNPRYGNLIGMEPGQTRNWQEAGLLAPFPGGAGVRVRAADGLLFATQYDIPWREELLDGWTFFDVSQSLEFAGRGLDGFVPFQARPWCLRELDGGGMEDDSDRERMAFLREYLPFSPEVRREG